MVANDWKDLTAQIRGFGENMRSARLRAGLTQAQLSIAAPLDRAAISRIECGERAPDLSTLIRLSRALDIQPQQLVRDIGPRSGPGRGRHSEHGLSRSPAAAFGANLRWARKRAGISQERLALDAKVDRAAISVYENGRREPNLRTILKLALELKVRPSALLEGIVVEQTPTASL